jgi:hypothetical protein
MTIVIVRYTDTAEEQGAPSKAPSRVVYLVSSMF